MRNDTLIKSSIKPLIKSLFVSSLFISFSGCVNLSKVNDYASNSLQSVKKFEELGYSFTQACSDKCRIEQLEKKQLITQDCACKQDKEADKVTLLLYKAIKGYFDGLTKLSAGKLTVYKFNVLQKVLKEGDFGEVKINPEQVSAYSKIATILTNAITNAYRKRKLSNYIAEANEAVKILLDALAFNLFHNLSKKLDIKKQRLESYYFDLSNDTTISAYENKKIIEEFNAAVNDIETKKNLLESYGRGLVNIAKGHQKMYDNRNKLSAKEIRQLLAQHASDIEDIIDEFNTLKNQH